MIDGDMGDGEGIDPATFIGNDRKVTNSENGNIRVRTNLSTPEAVLRHSWAMRQPLTILDSGARIRCT